MRIGKSFIEGALSSIESHCHFEFTVEPLGPAFLSFVERVSSFRGDYP